MIKFFESRYPNFDIESYLGQQETEFKNSRMPKIIKRSQ